MSARRNMLPSSSDVKDETDDLEQEIEDSNSNQWDDEVGPEIRDAAWARRIEEVNTASGLIGQRLLQGWTLLAEHCDTCHTPLMSLNSGPQICVLCQSRPTSTARGSSASLNGHSAQPQAQERETRRNGRSHPLPTTNTVTRNGGRPHPTTVQPSSGPAALPAVPPPAITSQRPPENAPRPTPLRVRRSEEVNPPDDQEVPRPRSVLNPSSDWNAATVGDPGVLRRNLSGASRGRAFQPNPHTRQTSGRTVTYSHTEAELRNQLNHTMYQFTRKLYVFNVQLEQSDMSQIGGAVNTLEQLVRGMRMVREFYSEMGDESDVFGPN